jgi:chitinase
LPESIDPYLCTHLIYAFAKVEGDTISPYEWNDESTSWSKGLYERTMKLKEQNSELKILLAIGGWNHGSGPFSKMANDDSMRSKFVQNSVNFLVKHGFDGLELDWEYPGSFFDNNLYNF